MPVDRNILKKNMEFLMNNDITQDAASGGTVYKTAYITKNDLGQWLVPEDIDIDTIASINVKYNNNSIGTVNTITSNRFKANAGSTSYSFFIDNTAIYSSSGNYITIKGFCSINLTTRIIDTSITCIDGTTGSSIQTLVTAIAINYLGV